MLPKYQIQANEAHFAFYFSNIKVGGNYCWIDNCNIYTKQENGKFKAGTIKGYIEIANIVSKEFMDRWIEIHPQIIQTINKKQKKKGKKNRNRSTKS